MQLTDSTPRMGEPGNHKEGNKRLMFGESERGTLGGDPFPCPRMGQFWGGEGTKRGEEEGLYYLFNWEQKEFQGG